ncbi:polyprenol reductase-like protein [Leptotrombidium deliense]|uniref:Polyprenal reductase n=1 Tax=Leptotrombidium deliense TaxID=299467 RepID=A0A443S876_9ACAR|nr:polyprenol reductase-like protein [Leptotrombidium deliense]
MKMVFVAKNLLWAEWISFSSIVTVVGLLVIYYSKLVPEAFHRIFKYGKAAELHDGAIKKLNKIELPKRTLTVNRDYRWFYHFYLFATTFYTILGCSVIQVYIFNQRMPKFLSELLDSFVGTHRKSTVTPESVIMAMLLIIIQVTRRLSECIFLSVYSDAKMNVIHYIFGFSFYFGVGLSVLAEAPGFTNSGLTDVLLGGNFITWNHVLGLCLFVWSSSLQYESHTILAKLRKDNKGRVVTYRHSIPKGGWFNLISCPHYFAEILIYMSLCVVFGGRSVTWWMVCCFVLTNQVIVGLFNHHWYLQTFKDYPKQRKAVIPFLLFVQT